MGECCVVFDRETVKYPSRGDGLGLLHHCSTS
jgi:hypothetical protein